MEIKKAKPVKEKRVDKKVLSFFLIVFPSLVLALTASFGVKVAMLFYQAVVVKQFVDSYYKQF